jgi:hypothetical protein
MRKSTVRRALKRVMSETNGWDDLRRAAREDMRTGELPRSAQQPRAFGMSVADAMKPGEGRSLSSEEAGTLLELVRGLIELARTDRSTYEREIRGILQTLHSRQMDLPRLNQSAPAEGMKESAQRVPEAQLRSQIRQQLIEEGLFDDVKDAAKGVAGAALEAGTKALLKKAAKAITGKDMPESKIDELETAMKAIIPALMSQSGSTFLKQLEKVGNLQLGKAAEKGAQKLGMGEKVAKL